MSKLVEYKEYLTKIESAKEKLKLLTRNSERNPTYENALNLIRTNAEQSKTICKRDVQEALVIPMERLCRYPIFMERLIKESGPGHSDYDNLKIVFDLLKEINSYVNACSGDNTGIIERERIFRRTGVQTLEFGFPMRTKDKTQFKEGLNADKVSKDGEKINWERIEVFVFHKALIITGKDTKANKYQIRVIKFENILPTTDLSPQMSAPEESKAVLRQKSQWKVKIKTTQTKPTNYELKFSTEQFAKTFHARLSNVYQTRGTDSVRHRFGKTENEGLKPISASFRRHSSCLKLKIPKIFRLPKNFQHFRKTEKFSSKPKDFQHFSKPKTKKFSAKPKTE